MPGISHFLLTPSKFCHSLAYREATSSEKHSSPPTPQKRGFEGATIQCLVEPSFELHCDAFRMAHRTPSSRQLPAPCHPGCLWWYVKCIQYEREGFESQRVRRTTLFGCSLDMQIDPFGLYVRFDCRIVRSKLFAHRVSI